MEKLVSKNWLYQRAKTIEKAVLKTNGKSLAAITISQRLYPCIIEYRDRDMLIDYDKYLLLRQECLSWRPENDLSKKAPL